MPEEIPMHDDIKCWNDPEALRPEEREMVEKISDSFQQQIL